LLVIFFFFAGYCLLVILCYRWLFVASNYVVIIAGYWFFCYY